MACVKCYKSVRDSTDGYKCNNYDCTSTEGVARYRLSLRVVDPENNINDPEAPTIQIVFFGPMAQELVGLPVHDLLNSEIDAETGIPKKITELYGKVLTLKVGAGGKFALRNPEICLQVNSIVSVVHQSTEAQDNQPQNVEGNESCDKAISEAGPISHVDTIATTTNKERPPFENDVSEATAAEDTTESMTPRNQDTKSPATGTVGADETKEIVVPETRTKQDEKLPEQPASQLALESQHQPGTPADTKVSTPVPPVLKRACPTKGDAEAPKYKRGEGSTRRKLQLSESGDRK